MGVGARGHEKRKVPPLVSFFSLVPKFETIPDQGSYRATPPPTTGIEMRLRFRGSCWDEAPIPAVPPPIPISTPRFRQQQDPPQPFRDLVQSQGLEAPRPYRLLRRPQPASNLSSWSCSAAIKHCWTAHDRDRLGPEEPGGGEDLPSAGRSSLVRHRRCLPFFFFLSASPQLACPCCRIYMNRYL